MHGDVACRVCLSKKDVAVIFEEENEDLLTKLRLVGGVSIVEDDLLPQCICHACSRELQFAYDLISQYKATCDKLSIVSRCHKNATEKPPTANFCENNKKTKAHRTLVAEIVVKEEMFSGDEEEIECLENKIMPGCSKVIDKYRIELVDENNEQNGVKVSGVSSNDSVNCSKQLYELNINDKACKAQDDYEECSNEFSDARSPMESEIIDILVKEEAKLADEHTDNVKSSEQNKSSLAVTSQCKGDICEVVVLEDTKRDGSRNGATGCGVSNKRFHDDFQTQKNLLCDHRTKCKIPECLKCEKHTKVFKNEHSTREYQTEAASLSRRKLKECSQPFVRVKRLRIKILQESVLQTNALDLNKDAVIFKYDKRDEKLSDPHVFKKLATLHSNPELQTCDKWDKSLLNGRLLGKHTSSDAFKCEQCGKKYSRVKNLRKHQTKHSNSELLACEKCGKSFSSEYLMNEHRKLHLNPDVFKCEKCEKRYSCKQNLREHQTIHSNPELHTCNKCGKSFANKQSMNEHEMLHLNPNAFKCEKCEKSFPSKRTLRQHKITHSNPELLTCDKCGKSFTNERFMKEHQLLHLNPDAFKCNQCDIRFSAKSSLIQHSIIHSNPELLTCDKCGKSYTNVHSMKLHQKWHLNTDAYKCEHCHKIFSSKSRLKSHQRIHLKLDSCKCEQCGKICLSLQLLKEHKIVHSNSKVLTCDKCGKSFITERSMNEHQMLHLDTNAFRCEKCGKRYCSKQVLSQHKKTHLNPELLTCEKCGKSYTNVRSMKEHLGWHLNPDAFKCEHCYKRFLNKKHLKNHQKMHRKPDSFNCE